MLLFFVVWSIREASGWFEVVADDIEELSKIDNGWGLGK